MNAVIVGVKDAKGAIRLYDMFIDDRWLGSRSTIKAAKKVVGSDAKVARATWCVGSVLENKKSSRQRRVVKLFGFLNDAYVGWQDDFGDGEISTSALRVAWRLAAKQP